MNSDIVGAVITLSGGALISVLNYLLSRYLLIKKTDKYVFSTVLRQIIQVGYLVCVYFVGDSFTTYNVTYLLVGAVLGVTIPMFFLTHSLVKLNESIKSDRSGKGE